MGKTIKDQLGRVVERIEGTVPPAVILVNPQLGENIGAACRAMLNFGLTELRLVAPRDGWPNPAAEAMAAGALPVLQQAKVYETTGAAIADLKYVLAATARRREMEIPVIGTDDVGPALRAYANEGTRTGILFGPEKAGLTNADAVLADAILTYPVNPAFQSLNLAQAVNVFAYIWASAEGAAPPELFQTEISGVAAREDLVRMFEHLEDELQASGFFYPPEKRALMAQNIRAPFTRAKMTAQEVQTMRGIIKALSKGRDEVEDKNEIFRLLTDFSVLRGRLFFSAYSCRCRGRYPLDNHICRRSPPRPENSSSLTGSKYDTGRSVFAGGADDYHVHRLYSRLVFCQSRGSGGVGGLVTKPVVCLLKSDGCKGLT